VAKKFKFNLQSVLNLKEFREELLKQDLCKLIEKLNEENDKYEVLMTELITAKDKLNHELSEDIKTVKVIECNDYIEYLNYLISNQVKIIKTIEQTIKEKRDEILKNEVEKKVIEKLKDKKLSSFTKETNIKTQKNIDDLTIQRFFFERGEKKIDGSIYSN